MNPSGNFQDTLSSDNGETLGNYTAVFCPDVSSFLGSDHFSCDDYADLRTLEPPIAYLRKIRIDDKEQRGQGHGSRLMERFIAAAIQRRARTAFVRMADEESSKEDLVKFYRKNGWEIFPCPDSDFPRFAIHKLR
jgi:GNAT superfamily N-acetyltransferase